MKLSEFSKLFESRAKCAEALGVSYHQLTNMIGRNPDVLELKDGRHIVTNKHNQFISYPSI